ncbi:MAG: DUF664 domain-containing protein [Acidimicrobiia bacterium]|nr:DUF664 domain-containing protein [Acidimicrobiia bacterium]
MRTNELLLDAFERVHQLVGPVVTGLSPEELAFRPDAQANSIAWLVWHLARVQDDHVADVAGLEQVWTAQGWADRFGLPFDVKAHGYGHTAAEVAQVVAPADLLAGYHEAVHALTVGYVGAVDAAELDRIVDTRWDPPVSVGVRLVSVLGDTLQHVGQAAYLRGLVERRRNA